MASRLGTCWRGMTRTCSGALPFMSLKATTSSSSWTISASISPAAILQKMQSLLHVHTPPSTLTRLSNAASARATATTPAVSLLSR